MVVRWLHLLRLPEGSGLWALWRVLALRWILARGHEVSVHWGLVVGRHVAPC